MTRRESLAYAAGIIDGEGHIGITKRHPKAMTNPKYTTRFGVDMTDRKALVFLQKLFSIPGSKFGLGKRYRKNHKPIFTLSLENDCAVNLCKCVLPFLLTKRRQAKIMIACRSLQNATKDTRRVFTRTVKVLGNHSGVVPVRELSTVYLSSCERFYKRIKKLNKRFKKGERA
jgi:hypothetical protein